MQLENIYDRLGIPYSPNSNDDFKFSESEIAEIEKADLDDPEAQFKLAIIYREKIGKLRYMDKDYEEKYEEYSKKIVDLYKKSMSNNFELSYIHLAYLYLDGIFVNKNLEKGRSILNIGSVKGFSFCSEELGRIYYFGRYAKKITY